MKKTIHPTYYPEAKITCACGNEIIVGSTQPEISIELCSNCHPFFTGKQKLVDTARRVEKFQDKLAKKEAEVATGKKARTAKRQAIKKNKKAKVEVEA